MKLKKYLTILFFSIACLCIGFAFGCKEEEAPTFTVDFVSSEHVKFVLDGEEIGSVQKEVEKDTVISFGLSLDYGYENPVVKGNGYALVAENGAYSFTVTEDIQITVSVSEDVLEGAGTSESPFLISSLKDLRYATDMINSSYSAYVTGYYSLENDIDCGGEQLDVIGDFESQYSFFAGNFNGNNHTISNYEIKTTGRTYVGLFGCVQATTDTGTGVISNLNLKNFKINATAAEDGNLCVGSVVAFAVGANIVACDVTDGTIYVYGSNYFSYAGGAIGVQQSISIQASEGLVHYLSSAEYVHTDVEIVATGYVYAAGGIVGHSAAYHERGASVILNSYAEGSIYGAMRSGGIVGWLDEYTSVANCYSTSYVSAVVSFFASVNDPEYFAYAGGIAGYAGAGSIITDSFSTCILEASAVNAGSEKGDIIAYAVPATDVVAGATYENCYSGSAVNATSADFIKNTLHWNEADWKIVNGSYPVTNLEESSNEFTITLNYGSYAVNGRQSETVDLEVEEDSYVPFSFYMGTELNEYLTADAQGYVSYGYFFDSACTRKVPFGYVPTRDITLYVGFANYAEVAGSYEYSDNGRTVELILNGNGTYSYVDVRSFEGATYTYDGTKLIFNDGLFARLSGMVAETDGVYEPWLNFEPYTFAGSVSDGKISVYDGNYFTKDKPLVFTASAQSAVTANDFVGTWERSATLKETYTFTASSATGGSWTYSWKNSESHGTYTVSNGVATFNNGKTATIDASGLLVIGGTYYSLEGSFFGTWFSPESGTYLSLDGYGTNLGGYAVASIDGTIYDSLIYTRDGFFNSQTNNNPYTYTIVGGYSLFGYFVYSSESKIITAMAYDGTGFSQYDLYLLDDYNGEWISENETFNLVDFNGLGIYKTTGNTSLGYLTVNGTRVPYECTVESGLEGTFVYNDVTYTLTVDKDNGTVTVTGGSVNAELSRKDEMYSLPLIDSNNSIYEFNGGGRLTNGGELTVTKKDGTVTKYIYKITSGSVDVSGTILVKDIVINLYDYDGPASSVGTITVDGYKFVLELDGQNALNLDLYLAFSDKTWAISSFMNSFYIGRFDLSYETTGFFNGQDGVSFAYFPEYNYVEVYYLDLMGSGSFHVYLLILNDKNIAVSSYPYLVDGDYIFAAPSDDVFGTWTNSVSGYELEFDGLADSMYATGIAFDSGNGRTYFYTRRFGKLLMWVYNDESIAYVVEHFFEDESGDNIYLSGGNRYNRLMLTEVDILNAPIFTANDGNGNVYNFNFDGTLTVGGEKGTYLLSEVNGDITTVVIEIDGEEYTAEVNHNGTLTIV